MKPAAHLPVFDGRPLAVKPGRENAPAASRGYPFGNSIECRVNVARSAMGIQGIRMVQKIVAEKTKAASRVFLLGGNHVAVGHTGWNGGDIVKYVSFFVWDMANHPRG